MSSSLKSMAKLHIGTVSSRGDPRELEGKLLKWLFPVYVMLDTLL